MVGSKGIWIAYWFRGLTDSSANYGWVWSSFFVGVKDKEWESSSGNHLLLYISSLEQIGGERGLLTAQVDWHLEALWVNGCFLDSLATAGPLVLLTGICAATSQRWGQALAIFRRNTEEVEKVRDMNSWNSLWVVSDIMLPSQIYFLTHTSFASIFPCATQVNILPLQRLLS